MSAPKPQSAPPAGARRPVVFPLWAKLGLLFGGLVGLFIAFYGWYGFRSDLEREKDTYRAHLLGLASAMASAVDGDAHATFLTQEAAADPAFIRLRDWLRGAIKANGLRWAGTLRRDALGHVTYVVAAEESDPMPVGYPMFDTTPAFDIAFGGEAAFEPHMEDEWGRYWSALAPIRDSRKRIVGVLELDFDADIEALAQATRGRRLMYEILLSVILAMGSAVVFARYLNRHLRALTATALRVASGDLERSVDIRSRDEIGLLGAAFNSMVAGLRDREFIRDTFGRYLTEEVAATVLADPESLKLGGEVKRITILISDLRGFTSLAESLDPETLVGLLNRYFSAMSDVIQAHGGIINELMGDGILVLFGAPTTRPDDALRAVACAVAMQRALEWFNAQEGRALEMGVALNTGEVVAGNLGSERRMKYGVLGDPINVAARLENFTVGNQVLISAATYAEVAAHVRVGEPLDVRVKGKQEPLRTYPLLAVGAPYDLAMPDTLRHETLRPVRRPAECFLLREKQIESTARPALVTEAGAHTLVLHADWRPERLGNYLVRIAWEPGLTLDGVYGKVTSVDPAAVELADGAYRFVLRLTSAPDDVWALLRRPVPSS